MRYTKDVLISIGIGIMLAIIIFEALVLAKIIRIGDSDQNIDVEIVNGESEVVEFEGLGLVPGEKLEYTLNVSTNDGVAHTIVFDFREEKDSPLADYVYVKLTIGDDVVCDTLLTDVSDFEIKSIPVRSLVFVEMVPEDEAEKAAWYDDLNDGDVLTFKYVYHKQVTITHRIVDIEPKGDGYIITLEGDNKNSEDNQGQQKIDTTNEFSPNYVVGKVVGQSIILGFILSIMKEPVGLIFAVIVPCAIVIIMEVVKIVSVLNEEKKKKAEEESQKKDDELEELRRRCWNLDI